MTSDETRAPVHRWLPGPLDSEVERSIQKLAATTDVKHIAVMPDAHLARDVCIGTVVATGTRLFPDAVGGDIGCGMAAARFDVEAEVLRDGRRAALVLAAFNRSIATRQRPSGTAELPEALTTTTLSSTCLERKKHHVGRVQLGTLGRGNHFLD